MNQILTYILAIITTYTTGYCEEIKIINQHNTISIQGKGKQTPRNKPTTANRNKNKEIENREVESTLKQIYERCVTLSTKCYSGGISGDCNFYINLMKASINDNAYAKTPVGEQTSSKLIEICRQMCNLGKERSKNAMQASKNMCEKFINDLR